MAFLVVTQLVRIPDPQLEAAIRCTLSNYTCTPAAWICRS